ncbi:MAG: UvrD-helicase domain-containing protein [Rikenellaceae bacterium]|nr:UvrD-helicase domain-containing protein [Rikenellaceae bacterium]
MGRIKILKASAGSGKTYRLAYEYVSKVIADTDTYRNILAVTFTNKATEEMKRRIIKEINDLANGHNSDGREPAFLSELKTETGLSESEIRVRAMTARKKILHDYSNFSIMTIDKFFQRIIHAFIREIGIDNDVNLELKTEGILSGAADKLIENSAKDPELRNWLTEFIDERIDDNKKWDFKSELVNLGKEIFTDEFKSLYSPKDKRELKELLSDINKWIADYTEKIKARAQEAVDIIDMNGLSSEDFAYGKYSFANYFYELASGNINIDYRNKNRIVGALESDDKWYTKSSKKRNEIIAVIPALRPILEDLCGTYDSQHQHLNTRLLIKENFRVFALLNDLSETVRSIVSENNMMLISDTTGIINDLIKNNDTPFIFEKAGNHFSHYMIDEFQDTSHSQWKNFIPLLNNAISQDKNYPVFVVGDIKQSIYRWRGGNWDILGSGVEAQFSQTDLINLDTNYRSKRDIIEFNNNLISRLAEEENYALNTILEDAYSQGRISSATRQELEGLTAKAYDNCKQKHTGTESSNDGYINITEHDKDENKDFNEDIFISYIEDVQRRGYEARDIAVIVRYNYEAVEIANILLNRKRETKGDFCYDVVTQQALVIGNSPVIQFIIACMRIAGNINRKISEAVYKKFLGHQMHTEIPDEEIDFIKSTKSVSIEEAFEMIVSHYRLGEVPDNTAYIQALHDQILSYSSSKISDMSLFLKWWEETGSSESINLPQGQNAITVITIHKSKGLQYPVVIIPYATWKMDPGSRSTLWGSSSDESLSALGNLPLKYKKLLSASYFADHYFKEMVYSHIDNINLLYVAVTRAEDELYIIMESSPNSKQASINRSIINVLREQSTNQVYAGDMPGSVSISDGYRTFEFGRKGIVIKQQKDSDRSSAQILYPVKDFKGKLCLRTNTDRIYETGTTLSRRNYGRIMHRIFESMITKDDVGMVIEKLKFDGQISEDEVTTVVEKIDKALSNDIIRSWFDGSWDKVRIENMILIPSETYKIKIPDRVMIKDGKVVVVDFKFGQKQDNKYIKQVRNYMYLLQQMGYENISGYLWYVESGNVEEIMI